MSKPKKKPAATKIFASKAVQALAIVALTIGVGALVLPAIFADTIQTPPNVNSLQATPGGGAGYTVTLKWNGRTNNKYVAKAVAGSDVRTKETVNQYIGFPDLNCNATYRFDVYPAKADGTKDGATASVTGKATCPLANFTSLTKSGSTMTASWANGNFATSYAVRYRATNGGALMGRDQAATTYTVTGVCNTSYQFYVSGIAGGQTGPASPVKTITTDACPPPSSGGGTTTPTPQTPTPQAPHVTPSGGSSSSNGGTKSTGSSSNPVIPVPSAPENFTATVSSNKVVELTWNSVTGATHYIITRSTDQINWVQIADTENTFYDDESGEFSTTYYYQLQAVGAGGTSGTVTTEATTEAFAASTSTITSDDKKVTVKIPEGAIEGDYSCTLASDETSAKTPTGQSSILGPYDLLCVTSDGDIINEFDKPVVVTLKLGTSAQGYKDLSVQLADGKTWKRVKSITYNQNKQEIGFKLASAQSFGVFGVKQGGSGWIIFLIIFLLLLIAGVIFFILRRRRNQSDDYSSYPAASLATTPAAIAASPPTPSAEEEFRQAIAQPDCSHLSMAQQVIPSSAGCQECEQKGTKWSSLRICLICGHVGCSDDSDEQHALKHFKETGHPLIYEYGNPAGNTIGWCYIDQTYI